MTNKLQKHSASGSRPWFPAVVGLGTEGAWPYIVPKISAHDLNVIEIHESEPLVEDFVYVPMDVFQTMLGQHHSDSERMAALERQVLEMRQQVDLLNAEPENRAIDVEQAKSEIKDYFNEHSDAVIYPSDVAEALRLDYDQTVNVIASLEADGQIEKS